MTPLSHNFSLAGPPQVLGYFLSPLRGCADTSALEREIDRQVYALYPPAAKFRQTVGPTPEGINIVEEAG